MVLETRPVDVTVYTRSAAWPSGLTGATALGPARLRRSELFGDRIPEDGIGCRPRWIGVLSEHHLDVLCCRQILSNCRGGNRLCLLALTVQQLPANLIGVFETPTQRQLLLTRLPLLRSQLQRLRLLLHHRQPPGCPLHVLLRDYGLLPCLDDVPLCCM